MGKGGIDAELRAHHAQTVGAKQTDFVTLSSIDHLAFEQCAARSGLGEACRQDDYRFGAGPPTALHDCGRLLGTHRNYDEIESLRHVLHRFVAGNPMHFVVLGVDREQFALVAGFEHVAHQHAAERRLAFAGADDAYRAWLQQRCQVVFLFHDGNLGME